ncbi:MAG: hypothetical protein JO079_12185 [Frankiaceae bacterium]|nr:hypothetical protein [Frankiaceae bacterium]MBV9369625.1 hypothetical protein [Frankiales bacterium]
MRRFLPALIAGFVVLVPAAVVPSPATAATTPTFDSVSWKHSALTISGVAMVAQTGTIHVTDPAAPGSGPNACRWYFHLTSTGGTGTVRRYTTGAKLTSGTVNDGTWTMTFYLSSTADGTWHLTSAETCSAGPSTTYAASSSAAFTVAGHHQPRVSWAVVPTPVPVANPHWSVKGRVYDADTGAGMPGVTVGEGASDTSCLYQQQGEGPGASLSLRTVTNANGYYALPARNGWSGLQCLGIVGKPEANPDRLSVYPWFRQFVLSYLPSVSATPAVASVAAGSTDAVNGHVVGGRSGCPVALQRLHGSATWRTVSTSNLRPSLRFTLVAQPAAAGRYLYRAYYPQCTDAHQVAASSKPFTITAT